MLTIMLLVVLTVLSNCTDKEEPVDPDIPSGPDTRTIKEKAAFPIGAAIKSQLLENVTYDTTLARHFNRISAEYEMKMSPIWTSPDTYNWENSDALVNYALDHNMQVHGHALLWYREYPTWFKNANYDSADFESHIKEYIVTVVGRYKGKIQSWDVANEIFNDNGTLRIDEFAYETFEDPLAFYGRCFQYARDADPDCKLFYNDYSVVLASGKRFAIVEMVNRFKEEGYPIDGIGGQFHYNVKTSESVIESGLTDMANTGLLFHISELDLVVNVDRSNAYFFSESEKRNQANKYQVIVELYEKVLPQDQKFGITTWGITDKYTWLTGYWHEKEYPLLFDESYDKKKAYEGFLKGLSEKEGN